jgi:hypothetical protein
MLIGYSCPLLRLPAPDSVGTVGRTLRVAGSLLAVATFAAAPATAASAAAAPATVAVTSKPVISLAANAGRIAYRTHFTDGVEGVCNSVHVRPLLGGRESVPVRCSRGGTDDRGRGVALGSHTLVYDSIEYEPVNATHDGTEAWVWRVSSGRKAQLLYAFYEITCHGSSVGPVAYGAGALFSRIVATEIDPAMECELGSGGGPGVSSMTSAGIRYAPAGAGSATAIPGAPGASTLAARWPTLAIVPLRLPQPMGELILPPARGTERVESWNLRTKTRRCTAGFAGVPAAVATNGARIAAIVPTSPGRRLVILDARTCAHLRTRPLDGHIQPAVAVGAHVAAWVSGRSIMTLDLATGRVSRVYRAALVPHGLVISDGRLVWWITGRHGGRVLRLPLP